MTDSVADVRPWKELRQATTLGRPVCFTASLSAASLASAPLLQNRDLPKGAGTMDAKASPRSACSLIW